MKATKQQRNVRLQQNITNLQFRKEEFTVVYHSWIDQDTGEEFTTEELDELNLAQVHNQYRSRYGIPFIDEIIQLREQYGLNASKMGEVLGLGANAYRNYENGEIPSVSTGRLIQLAKDPAEFRKLVELSSNKLDSPDINRINLKLSESLRSFDINRHTSELALFGSKAPNEFNGYRIPSIEKIGLMVRYFATHLRPFKTKMNKLLFYADFSHYASTGYSISGLSYMAISYGPVPKNYGGIYDKVCDEGFVDIEEVEVNGFEGERFFNQEDTVNLSAFTELEKDTMECVVKEIGSFSTSKVIKVSHDEYGWQHNVDNHGRINYSYGFSLHRCR